MSFIVLSRTKSMSSAVNWESLALEFVRPHFQISGGQFEYLSGRHKFQILEIYLELND